MPQRRGPLSKDLEEGEGTENHGHRECRVQRPWGRTVLIDQEEDSGWSTVWNGGKEVGSEKWGGTRSHRVCWGHPNDLGFSYEGQRSLEMRTT